MLLPLVQGILIIEPLLDQVISRFMPVIIKSTSDIQPSEITPKSVYMNRRKFMQRSVAGSLLLTVGGLQSALADIRSEKRWPSLKNSSHSTDETLNSYQDITTYNNFYEFGSGKKDPYKNATEFDPKPWSITVEGECDKQGTYDLEDFINSSVLEERIYRLRCVEGWSMVIPWVGFSLADMLKKFEPNSKAKYVEFTTLFDKSRMPGQKTRLLNWPYVEGLRIDEAMNELPIMAVGLYGDILPNQNGDKTRLRGKAQEGGTTINERGKRRGKEKKKEKKGKRKEKENNRIKEKRKKDDENPR